MQDNRVVVDHTSRAAQVTPVAVTATSADGVALTGVHLPGEAQTHGTALVVAHAFTHHVRHPITRRQLAEFATEAPVVALDMRGHGRSAGRNTVGDREPLDLDAAVAAARELGHERVATIGFSLGAAVALRQAASGAHAMGVRLDGGWEVVVPPSPVEVVAEIEVPLLLVHIAGDRYFSATHAQTLAAASQGRAQLWEEPGDGHGESGTHPELARRIARWAVAASVESSPREGRERARSTVESVTPAERRAARSEVG
jgi:pimeloyl-ACP methyl ester carboxylesterase